MRVLFITHYASMLGANRSLLHLILQLKNEHAVEPLVFCPKHGPFTEALENKGINYLVRPFSNWASGILSIKFWIYPFQYFLNRKYILPDLIASARAFDPDIIHSNSSVVSLGWQINAHLQKKHVWHIREYGWQDYGLLFFHGKQLLRKKLLEADAVIFISETLKQAKSIFSGLKSYVIYNGVGPRQSLLAIQSSRVRAQDAPFTFLIIGLLHPSKGQIDAVRAFAKASKSNPGMQLLIAGKGRKLYTLRLYLLRLILGMKDKIKLLGFIPNPAPLYGQADAVLMCSKFEAMGRVTVEAMTNGKPVIGFNGGATSELIQQGFNGLLYNTTAELAENMSLLFHDPALCQRLGENAKKYAVENFSDENYAAACYQVYQKVLKKSN